VIVSGPSRRAGRERCYRRQVRSEVQSPVVTEADGRWRSPDAGQVARAVGQERPHWVGLT
jgi:hypothetical protein